MTTKHEVIRVFKQHPEWTSTQIADQLDCCDSYVRATLHRNGLKLVRRTRNHLRDRVEELEKQLCATNEAMAAVLKLVHRPCPKCGGS